MRLHSKASVKCQAVVRHVVSILRRNLGTHFFQFDAALVRDGCFFAGFLLAGESGTNEDVETCLQALREMRWTFSKSEDREQTVRMIWESRMNQARNRNFTNSPTDDLMRFSNSGHPYARRPLARPISVPPLSLSLCTVPSSLGSASAPNTACGTSGDWQTCTPPSSSGTGMYDSSVGSHRGSPTSPHDGLHVDGLHSKHAPVGASLMLGDSGHSARPGDPSGLDQVFFFNYGGVGDSSGTHSIPQPSTSLPPASAEYTSGPYFDASAVVFSNTAIGQQGPGNMTTSSGVSGDGRSYEEGSFYQ